MGGLDEEVKNQKEETKIVDLDEEKNKRKPFHYWTVGGRDYRLKLKASNINTSVISCIWWMICRHYL